ncbi:MAG: hypothetical protein QOE92_1061 [Chloroflexota bacterium]|nr:hypothetical protein [Chloroflexota bacterium]
MHTARLVSYVRWAGVGLGVVQAFLTSDPEPVFGWRGVLLAAAVMAAYNVPATLAHRLPSRWLEPVLLGALVGDFAVCTSWMLLTSNDVYSTSYAVFGLVSIEAAVLYRWRGAIAFTVAFAAVYGVFYWVRWADFGFAPVAGSVFYRTGLIAMMALFLGGIAHESERRRQAAAAAAEWADQLRNVALEKSERYQSLLQNVSDLGEGFVSVDGAGRILYANEAYCRLTGYTLAQLRALGSFMELIPEDERPGLIERTRRREANNPMPDRGESAILTRDGQRVDVDFALKRLELADGVQMVSIVRDITDKKRAEEALRLSEQQAKLAARVDSLTQVPNRRAWDEELPRAIARAKRDGAPLVVGLLDLDSFKEYNDDWGHHMGDRLLEAYATGWRSAMREVDFVARYGGDEFAVILPGTDLASARQVLDRLRGLAPERQTFSVGLALWDGSESPGELVARADAALYETKRAGRGRVVAASAPLDNRGPNWSLRVPQLLEGRAMRAVYQPICRLEDLETVGYEALARPLDEELRTGVETMFATAQRLGYSRDLDWLCRRAAVQYARFPPGTRLFINVGVHALLDPLHGVDQMELLLLWGGRDPSDIVLEISEREQISDLARLREVLADYRASGFSFAMDDVGEGHSTMEVLAATQPEYIKVASRLTRGVADGGPRSAVLALVTFGQASGGEVIAEGLETAEQVDRVRDLGVSLGQGFGLGRPEEASGPIHGPAVIAAG